MLSKISKKAEFTSLSLQGDDEKVRFYTRLPNYEILEWLCQLLEPLLSKYDKKIITCISLFEQLLMVLAGL